MLNKLLSLIREYDMLHPGDRVICAISGGADSVALTFAMYLLREKLGITLEAAHFNHHLRGAESQRDEDFVRELCDRLDIPLYVGQAHVQPGKKGLEAAARDARYAFFETLPGLVATAHTADDNAETVLMHLVRGTGLKGLGGIAPVRGRYLRPMLQVTRREVEAFLREYHLTWVQDSSNDGDVFLRNRIRHRIMPLLTEENPRLAENLSTMARGLRGEEAALEALTAGVEPRVEELLALEPALRRRALRQFLIQWGVPEPENAHVAQMEALVVSDNPSARAQFPGGITIGRVYDRLEPVESALQPPCQTLECPGEVVFGNYRIRCTPSREVIEERDSFTVTPQGRIRVRSRCSGDTLRRKQGRKTLKKILIDEKIPAACRAYIPVLADDGGILGVAGLGPDRDRLGPGVRIWVEDISQQPQAEKNTE